MSDFERRVEQICLGIQDGIANNKTVLENTPGLDYNSFRLGVQMACNTFLDVAEARPLDTQPGE